MADGHHRFDSLPLPELHPLRHGQFAVDIVTSRQRIVTCRFDISGSHRGDEKLLEVRDFKQGLAHMNRHSWLTPAFAETLYARIIERALGLFPSERALALRELVLALNRSATEAYWDAVESSLHGRSPSLEHRERVLGVLEQITGARMHHTYTRIGGVASDLEVADNALALGIDEVSAAVGKVLRSKGSIGVQLPKVLRLPAGDYYEEIDTPHGVLGIWVFSKGDKVPHRVHLRTSGFATLSRFEHDSIGMTTTDFFMGLSRIRLAIGEVAR